MALWEWGGVVWLKLGPVGSTDPSSNISASVAIKWGLAGFSDSTVWLIFAAFMLGLGYEKSGLGCRIALVKILGHKTLGLGYAIAIADGILAPFIPSNSARSGGIFILLSHLSPPPFFYPSLPFLSTFMLLDLLHCALVQDSRILS